MKKIIICVFLLCAVSIGLLVYSPVIGEIRGAELEQIILNGVVYEQDDTAPFGWTDRGRFLGIVSNERTRFMVFSVKGDKEQQYLYRLWSYDGAFYCRTNQ